MCSLGRGSGHDAVILPSSHGGFHPSHRVEGSEHDAVTLAFIPLCLEGPVYIVYVPRGLGWGAAPLFFQRLSCHNPPLSGHRCWHCGAGRWAVPRAAPGVHILILDEDDHLARPIPIANWERKGQIVPAPARLS